MLIRCVKEFRDLATKGRPLRKPGEEWEADASRLAGINRAGYGVMAEAVRGEVPPARRATRPGEAELEEMTVKQLVELCVSEKVETPSKPRKADLVEALKAHYGEE